MFLEEVSSWNLRGPPYGGNLNALVFASQSDRPQHEGGRLGAQFLISATRAQQDMGWRGES